MIVLFHGAVWYIREWVFQTMHRTSGPSVVVVGAGAVGMSCAVQIQDAIPGCRVTVVSEGFTTDTCSDGAAGMFRPTIGKLPGTSKTLIRKWLTSSWQHFDKLVHSAEGPEAGIQIIAGYQFTKDSSQPGIDKDFIYDHRMCTEKELQMFPAPHYRQGFRCTTLMTECRKYLPYLMRKFRNKGGQFEQRKVHSLEEFVGRYDLIVVCTGFGSKYLLDDQSVYSSRGHLIRVKAPWIKQFVYTEDEEGNCTYIYPGVDNVVIGGTRQKNDEDTRVREHDHTAIWERACAIMPSLQAAEILWDWVGLRPYREPLRLESEVLNFSKGSIPVVYCYGHGGEGVSLSWGTAVDATQLVVQQLAAKMPVHSRL